MARDIADAVRDACLWLPEAEEVPSHGMPDYRVRGKTFATFAVNHHGDGRISLWLNSPPGAQDYYVESDPKSYFVPPYVGPRGWLGVHLDKGLGWQHIATRIREAYERVAPAALTAELGKTPKIAKPEKTLDPEVIDPLSPKKIQTKLERLRKLCLALPESSETKTFGNPTWRAGKKTFCSVNRYRKRLKFEFWAGPERQAMLTFDERYEIPKYMGHNGWISLDAEGTVDWEEVRENLLVSYRHFALKRMLKELDEG